MPSNLVLAVPLLLPADVVLLVPLLLPADVVLLVPLLLPADVVPLLPTLVLLVRRSRKNPSTTLRAMLGSRVRATIACYWVCRALMRSPTKPTASDAACAMGASAVAVRPSAGRSRWPDGNRPDLFAPWREPDLVQAAAWKLSRYSSLHLQRQLLISLLRQLLIS